MVIDRYLAKEVMQTLLAVLVVLLLIFMGRYFALYLADASAGKISAAIVVDMLLLQTLASLSVILPFGLYVAVLLAFGRLYKDSEMTALAACGVGIGRVLRTVLALAVLCSGVVAVLAFWGTPWAHEKALQVKEQTCCRQCRARRGFHCRWRETPCRAGPGPAVWARSAP